jgi:hypothetical protein
VSRGTLDTGLSLHLSHTGLLPSLDSVFQPLILLDFVNHYAGPQPQLTEVNWFGLFRVRSPLLAESLLISFPVGT